MEAKDLKLTKFLDYLQENKEHFDTWGLSDDDVKEAFDILGIECRFLYQQDDGDDWGDINTVEEPGKVKLVYKVPRRGELGSRLDKIILYGLISLWGEEVNENIKPAINWSDNLVEVVKNNLDMITFEVIAYPHYGS